ncbi:MAG: DUF6151 family protein [Proteobacteria bacterium]|nr:DUF6151 family protein [Pseudomonadota bacterium]
MDVDLKCRCGKFTGTAYEVTPSSGNHLLCYCKDCQAFAKFLGRSQDLLDEAGGTEVFQLTPAQIRISKGLDQIRCIQLTPRLMRWYTDCCKTPAGNTMPSAKMPFVGVEISLFSLEKGDRKFVKAFGPILEKCFGRYACGHLPPDAKEKATVGIFVRIAWFLLKNRLSGKSKPHPYFHDNGDPIVTPVFLEKEVLGKLYQTRID